MSEWLHLSSPLARVMKQAAAAVAKREAERAKRLRAQAEKPEPAERKP